MMSSGEEIEYVNESTGARATFVLDGMLGKGQFGEVYKAYCIESDPSLKFPYCVACKKQEFRDREELEEIKSREIMLNQSVTCKNIIYMYWAIRKESDIYFFFHYYNGGCLSDLIKQKKNITQKLAAKIVKQLLDGLIVLHNNNFVHRDLKPDNILLHFDCMPHDANVSKEFIKLWDCEINSWFTVVIADLGMGREIDELEMSKAVGTPLYRAPEVEGNKYDSRSDILSLGIIAFELLVGEPLFSSRQAKNLTGLHKLWKKTTTYDFKGKKLSWETMQFLQYCLQKKPDDRLEADELYELDFIQKAYDDTANFTKPKVNEQMLDLTKHINIE